MVTLDDTAAGAWKYLSLRRTSYRVPNNIIGDIRAVYFHIFDDVNLLAMEPNFSIAAADNVELKVTNELYSVNNVFNFAASNGDNINPLR